jgi:hypothetical protein
MVEKIGTGSSAATAHGFTVFAHRSQNLSPRSELVRSMVCSLTVHARTIFIESLCMTATWTAVWK